MEINFMGVSAECWLTLSVPARRTPCLPPQLNTHFFCKLTRKKDLSCFTSKIKQSILLAPLQDLLQHMFQQKFRTALEDDTWDTALNTNQSQGYGDCGDYCIAGKHTRKWRLPQRSHPGCEDNPNTAKSSFRLEGDFVPWLKYFQLNWQFC